MFPCEQQEGGRKEENKLLLQRAITLLYSQGEEAPQVIPVVAATSNPALPWTRVKGESGTERGSLVNEKSDCSDASSAEFFLPGICLSVPVTERQKHEGRLNKLRVVWFVPVPRIAAIQTNMKNFFYKK